MNKLFVGAALVLAASLAGGYGWSHYQTQQEIDVAATYARKSAALAMQQLSMIEDGGNVTVADYFSASRRASDELSACVVDIDSLEWRRSPEARDSAKALCSSTKGFVTTLSGATRLRIDRASAKERSEKTSTAISKSKNSYEIEILTAQMNSAFDEQIKSLEQEIADMKPNRERIQAMLDDDSKAVAVLGVPGLSQDVRARLAKMYPDK